MNLSNLPKTTQRADKRLGRGIGSGKGKTSGKGTKGQKARGKIPLGFTSGALPLFRVLPLLRGWGNRKVSAEATVIHLDELKVFSAGEVVDLENLIKKGVVSEKSAHRSGVKILGNGLIDKKLTVKVPVSAHARSIIEKAGGSVG